MNCLNRMLVMSLTLASLIAFAGQGMAAAEVDEANGKDKKPAAKPAAKTALQFIYSDDAEIAEYLKKNKCVIGSWELKKETEYGWEGNLHYACANHRPGGVRYVEGPLKVLKPKAYDPPLNNKFDGFGNEVILRKSKKEGYYEIVAFVVPIAKVQGKRWVEGVGDMDWAGLYDKKYRYSGMVPDATAQLKKGDAALRVEAARVLESLGADAGDAITPLIEQIAVEKNDLAREAMVRAVGTVGYNETDKVMPTLIKSLADDVTEVRIAAAQAIAFQGEKGKAAIEPLIEATADQAKFVRIEAVRALAHLGVNQPTVIMHLEKLSKGEDVALRQVARRALQKIESDTPVVIEP